MVSNEVVVVGGSLWRQIEVVHRDRGEVALCWEAEQPSQSASQTDSRPV